MSSKYRMSRTLGENLRVYRQQMDFSQEFLAKKMAIPRATLSRIEAGRGNPSAFLLYRIAQALNITIEKLLVTEEAQLPRVPHYIEPIISHKVSGASTIKYQTSCQKLTLHSIEMKESESVVFPSRESQTPQLIVCTEGQVYVKCTNGSGILMPSQAMETLASYKKNLIGFGPGKSKALVVTGQRDPFEVF